MSDETKYELNVYCRLLNKDLTNLMELLRKQDKDKKPVLYAGRYIQKIILPVEEYQKMYQRLESIDNANPSEAIRCLIGLEKEIIQRDGRIIDFLKIKFDVIKQALLKAQEQEKENAYIEKIKTMMKQKDCVLRYIESEDCFAVKTILSDGWYKLTPDFVDNNVREEIKPLPLIEKNKQLKEENAEYKRVLEIIKGKVIWVENGKLMCGRYADTEIELEEDDFEDKKEFDLLKRWLR